MDPIIAGYEAFYDGIALDQNPCYRPRDQELWEAGWYQAQDECDGDFE